MNGDLGHIRRGRDIREVRAWTSRHVSQVDEAPDEPTEAKRDMDGREAEHQNGDPENNWRNLARVSETQNVDVRAEQTDVDACVASQSNDTTEVG